MMLSYFSIGDNSSHIRWDMRKLPIATELSHCTKNVTLFITNQKKIEFTHTLTIWR